MSQEPDGWFEWILIGAIGIIGSIVEVYRRKVDKLEAKSSNYVTREEMREYFRALGDERVRMHEENAQRLEQIRDEIARMASRIDRFNERH